jgi:hypothetical protein
MTWEREREREEREKRDREREEISERGLIDGKMKDRCDAEITNFNQKNEPLDTRDSSSRWPPSTPSFADVSG